MPKKDEVYQNKSNGILAFKEEVHEKKSMTSSLEMWDKQIESCNYEIDIFEEEFCQQTQSK